MGPSERPLIQLQAGVGQPLLIELQATPSAALVWSPTVAPGDCTLTQADSVPDGSGVGGHALQRFTFVCTSAGQRQLRFELKRPWESTVRAVQRVDVDVR